MRVTCFYAVQCFAVTIRLLKTKCLSSFRPEDFLVPELQATEEEKSKLESGLTNGEEPMDQDLSDVPTKCISATESMEIK